MWRPDVENDPRSFLTFELHVFTKRIRLSGSDAACGYTAGLS